MDTETGWTWEGGVDLDGAGKGSHNQNTLYEKNWSKKIGIVST